MEESMARNWVKLSGKPVYAVNMDHVVSVAFDAFGARLSLAGGEAAVPPTFAEMYVLNLPDQDDIDAIKRWLDARDQ
jgi:hypothetical protein